MASGTKLEEVASSNNDVARSAFDVTLGSLFGLIAGVGSQVVIASVFGAGVEMDAFLTALAVPIYLQAVLLAGLPFVLIPAFVREDTAGRENEAWALAGTFLWLAGGVVTVIAIGGALFAQRIVALYAPGLSPAKAHLAARMLAILMFAVPLTALRSLTKGVQHARSRFFWPAVAPAIGSVGNVMTLVVLYRAVGPLSLAWGYLVSAALQASVTVVPVLRHGWRRLMPLSDARVVEMVRLIAPFVLFGIVARSTSVFERYFASGLPDGDLSYLGYAYRIASIVMTLLGSGIAAAVFPAMARAYAQNGETRLVEKAEYGFRLSLAVALPALAILSGIAVPLVTVLFERGAFRHTATLSVSRIVPMVIISNVVCGMLGYVTNRTFYVIEDTRTAPMIGAVTALLYIFLAKGLADTWGYVGLALAQSLYSALAILVLSILLMRRLRFLHRNRLLKDALMYGWASLVAFLGAQLISRALAFLPALAQLLAASIVAGPLYITILFRLDRDIALSVLEVTGMQRMVRGMKVAFRRFAETARG